MYIGLRLVGKVIVDDMGNAFDIQAPGGDVRCDQHGFPCRPELGQRAGTRCLTLVSVKRRSVHTGSFQHSDYLVRPMLDRKSVV